MYNFFMGIRLKILVIVSCVVAVYGLYYLALPKLLNLEDISPIISRQIKANYGFNIKIDNPAFKMGYLPAVWLKADNIRILNDDETNAMALEKPVIKISLFPMIFGRFNIKYFSANNVYADLYCDSKLRVSLGQYLMLKSSDFAITFSSGKVFINKFKIDLNDKIKNDKIVLDGNYFNIDRFNKKKYLKASMHMNIKSKNNISSMLANIDTKLPFKKHLDDYQPEIFMSAANVNISDFSNYISYFTQGNIDDISGIVNLDVYSDKEIFEQKHYTSNFIVDNFSIKTKLFEKDFSHKGRIHLKSDALLKGSSLSIPNFSVNTNKVTAKISGSIDKIDSNKPFLDVDFKMLNVRSEDIADLLPYCHKFDEVAKISVSVIKNAGFYSDVNVDLNIKGDYLKPKIFGDIKITDAYVTRPINKAPKNADIIIKYIGDKLKLNVNVPTDVNQSVSVDGAIDVYNDSYADLHITSTPMIDLSEAERVLMPVHKTFNFLLGPVPIMSFKGYGSIDLVVKGTKKNPQTFGWFKTNNATVAFDDAPGLILKNADSVLNFDNFNTKFNLINGQINSKKVEINGDCDLSGKFKFKAKLPNQNLSELFSILKSSKMLVKLSNTAKMIDNATGEADLALEIEGDVIDVSDLDFCNNVHAKGDLLLNSAVVKPKDFKGFLKNISGKISFDDMDLNLNLTSKIGNAPFKLSGDIKSDKANLQYNIEKAKFVDLFKLVNLPNIAFDNKNNDASSITLKGRYNGPVPEILYKNIKADGIINFKNFNVIYKPFNLPIKVANGTINLKNDLIDIKRFNINCGTAPIVVGGKISNIFAKPYFDLSIFARPNQKFVDCIYNSRALYPLKLKGDIFNSSLIYGTTDKINIKSNIKVDKNSSIYYMGASLGDPQLPINLFLNAVIEKDRLTLNKLNYDKIIFNSAPTRQLSANGQVLFNEKNNNVKFNNFKLVTSVPTDLRIFNVIFKKPFIKKGFFTSDILLNGSVTQPVIRGNLNLIDMDIPFIDASIKNISMKFLNNNLIANVAGNVLENNFKFNIDAVNKLYPPYIINNAILNTGKFNVDNFYKAINDSDIHSASDVDNNKLNSLDLSKFTVKNFTINAEEIILDKNSAKNLFANISLKSNVLNINNFKFNIAKGIMDGRLSYNIGTKNSKFDLNVANVDANLLTSSLLELKGQIYGDLNGKMSLSCKGDSQDDCLKSLGGEIKFIVKDGRMPKLGSLEYLLKAGNLVKSGITGLSVNNLIEIVVPLKTGNFDEIKGSININKGIADKIQISTNGKDLNLFIIGEYDLSSKQADMYVFGRLSRKISTILGPIGNLSLNTLFNTIPGVNLSKTSDTGLINSINKIPGLELSNKMFRVFAADIHGDISGDDYVESFRWIE